MAWKYIVLEATFGETKVEFPVIFPDKTIHLEVVTVMRLVAPVGKHQPRVVSAGKIEHVDVDGIGGDSKTLKIASRADDKELIETYEYIHGIK